MVNSFRFKSGLVELSEEGASARVAAKIALVRIVLYWISPFGLVALLVAIVLR